MPIRATFKIHSLKAEKYIIPHLIFMNKTRYFVISVHTGKNGVRRAWEANLYVISFWVKEERRAYWSFTSLFVK